MSTLARSRGALRAVASAAIVSTLLPAAFAARDQGPTIVIVEQRTGEQRLTHAAVGVNGDAAVLWIDYALLPTANVLKRHDAEGGVLNPAFDLVYQVTSVALDARGNFGLTRFSDESDGTRNVYMATFHRDGSASLRPSRSTSMRARRTARCPWSR